MDTGESCSLRRLKFLVDQPPEPLGIVHQPRYINVLEERRRRPQSLEPTVEAEPSAARVAAPQMIKTGGDLDDPLVEASNWPDLVRPQLFERLMALEILTPIELLNRFPQLSRRLVSVEALVATHGRVQSKVGGPPRSTSVPGASNSQ